MSEHAGRPTEESSGGHDAGERVRASFGRQGLMRLLGAEVVEVGEGRCVIEVPFADGITQQESYTVPVYWCHRTSSTAFTHHE